MRTSVSTRERSIRPKPHIIEGTRTWLIWRRTSGCIAERHGAAQRVCLGGHDHRQHMAAADRHFLAGSMPAESADGVGWLKAWHSQTISPTFHGFGPMIAEGHNVVEEWETFIHGSDGPSTTITTAGCNGSKEAVSSRSASTRTAITSGHSSGATLSGLRCGRSRSDASPTSKVSRSPASTPWNRRCSVTLWRPEDRPRPTW